MRKEKSCTEEAEAGGQKHQGQPGLYLKTVSETKLKKKYKNIVDG